MLIESPLMAGARLHGNATALLSGSQPVSYAELAKLVARTCTGLESLGIQGGTRVGIVASNSIEYVTVLLALFHTRAVACPINPRFVESTIEEYTARTGCTHLLIDEKTDYRFDSIHTAALKPLISESRSTALNQLDLSSDAAVIATSGSTGTPKAVLLSLGNLYYNALGSNQNIRLLDGDRWLLSLPLYHVGGLGILCRCLLAGATVVLPDSPGLLVEAVLSSAPTHLSLVHTQLYRLMRDESASRALPSMKAILLGGSAFPSSLITEAYNAGIRIHTSYGLSEMASQVCTTRPNASLEALTTSGNLLPYRELKISEDGEILVKGETRFRGYLESSGLSQPFRDDGWFASGDLGMLDENSNLIVQGRKDNQFVSGGENIHPEEIESAFYKLPDVEEVIVVPIEDAEFGHRPIAFVRVKDRRPGEETSFDIARLADYLPRFKLPVACYPWPTELADVPLKPGRRSLVEHARKLRS